ncbi:MAG: dihydropteridine reductase [Clostridia bacterium]|nr:dihydropteridine reductase [Clostridia bacterium]
MNTKEIKMVENIKARYSEKTTEKTKLEELKELDRKVKQPTKIFAYSYGIVGSLILGTGMCLAMKVIGSMMVFGIVVGLIGIGMVSTTYMLYKKLLQRRKAKYSQEIIEKSNELLNEKGE